MQSPRPAPAAGGASRVARSSSQNSSTDTEHACDPAVADFARTLREVITTQAQLSRARELVRRYEAHASPSTNCESLAELARQIGFAIAPESCDATAPPLAPSSPPEEVLLTRLFEAAHGLADLAALAGRCFSTESPRSLCMQLASRLECTTSRLQHELLWFERPSGPPTAKAQ